MPHTAILAITGMALVALLGVTGATPSPLPDVGPRAEVARVGPYNGTSNGTGNSSSTVALNWTLLAPPGSPPGTAAGAAFAYDPVAGYDVLFGGCVGADFWYSACTPSNATWTYQNGSWTELFPTTSPSARYYSSMVWANGEILLFGGNRTSGFLNDTWTFANGTWTPVYSTLVPPARAAASLAYDPLTQTAILFGGESYRLLVNAAGESYIGADYHDTWAFSNGQWTQLSPAHSPGGRDSAMMAYDPASQQIVLFGGFNWTIYNTADTWVFANGTWTQASTPSSAPGPRNNGAFAFDPALGGLLLWGGHTGWQFYSDTWLWVNSTWTQLSTPNTPAAGWGASLAQYGTGCMVLYGGFVAGPNPAVGQYFNTTWSTGTGCTSPAVNSTGTLSGNTTGNGTGGSSGVGNPTGNDTGSGNGTGSPGGVNTSPPAPWAPRGGAPARTRTISSPPLAPYSAVVPPGGLSMPSWAVFLLVGGVGLGIVLTWNHRRGPR
jgi:hypothetical protein